MTPSAHLVQQTCHENSDELLSPLPLLRGTHRQALETKLAAVVVRHGPGFPVGSRELLLLLLPTNTTEE